MYLDSPVFVSTMVLRLLCLKMKVDELLLNLDNNRVSGVLLVDYCKASDMVNHNLLLLKLTYGFTNRAYNIIGVSLISRVDVSWSALMARNRLWRV